MNRSKIIEAIHNNLKYKGIQAEKVFVQPDPYGGWNIAVISSEFKGLSWEQRKRCCLRNLEEIRIEWLDLLTPEEAQWAGPLPGEIRPEDLPLWPESLAKSSVIEANEVLLPSDIDEDFEPPIVATFYSLRGGVGRSTALAYTARVLAESRRKVVCVDMDLEAPALSVLFACNDPGEQGRGVVDLLLELDRGEDPDYASHLLSVPNTDNLFVLPAGHVSADYARKLRYIDPSVWYREDRNPLRLLLSGLSSRLPFVPDVILLDARTGITDLSGPLLFDLADIAVIVFFPHPQARSGTELLVRSLLNTVTRRSTPTGAKLVPEIRFLVSPIPASKSREVVRRYERRPLEWIAGWLERWNQARERAALAAVEPEEITHFVRYREDIATSDSAERDEDVLRAFEPVAQWVQRFVGDESEDRIARSIRDLKRQALEELSFSTGTAENQQELLRHFVRTENTREASSPSVSLVLGRKGTGKTALFRYLSEREGERAIVVHGPRELVRDKGWILTADGFQVVDSILSDSSLKWRHFWILYISIAIERSLGVKIGRPHALDGLELFDQRGIFDALKATMKAERGGLHLAEWLRDMDRRVAEGTLLLFDGLDTGFGSSPEERCRRKRSIEGLFDVWMDIGESLSNLRFKIFLREDIWRHLDFDNKSHLFGRSVSLRWSDQAAFLKVVLKQAMESASFRNHESLVGMQLVDVDEWPDETVRKAWNVLVGERMKGGQTAYTRNWVWRRLADANGDRSPRHLLQLFYEAVAWERNEERKAPFDKAFIRPRALTRCLPRVSEEAVTALREEFGELAPLLKTLQRLGRTPVAAGDLAAHGELLPLAREVGLLGVYEERGEEVARYKVPDLYRYGLGMTRKGQA